MLMVLSKGLFIDQEPNPSLFQPAVFVFVFGKRYRGANYEFQRSNYISSSSSAFRIIRMRSRDADGPDGSEEQGTLRVKLSSSSIVARASLYVNGRFKGFIRRSRYRSFPLPSGRVRIYAKSRYRGRWYRTRVQSVTIRPNRRRIMILNPRKRYGGGY